MAERPPPARAVHRIPLWALIVGPILAAILSNADVLFLALARTHTIYDERWLAITATVPLSIGACGVTLWFFLRLRSEVDLRAEAERDTRAAMSDLAHSLERERMLRRELDHRVRNNLTALLGIVGMYEAGASRAPIADVLDSLAGKIVTLRESYNLIASTHGEGIDLPELLTAVLSTLLGDRSGVVSIHGPSVRLNSREANALAMIVHELVTNAFKHGSLRSPEGRIAVSWHTTIHPASRRVELQWVESPLPEQVAPMASTCDDGSRTGMGLTLMHGLAESDLRGSATFTRDHDRWSVSLVASLQSESPARTPSLATEEVVP